MQAAEQAQKLREARKEQANLEGNVNDMERAQDFLKAGNVKVLFVALPHVNIQDWWLNLLTYHPLCLGTAVYDSCVTPGRE